MEGHTHWEDQETIERVDNVVEEEVAGDNASPDLTTFDVFDVFVDNASPDNLVDEDVVEEVENDTTGGALKEQNSAEIMELKRLPRRQAQCAQDQGGVRPGAVRPAPGAVWDKMVVVHANARNHRELNAASIQVETVLGDGIDGSKIHLKRQYQISRESEKDKNGAISRESAIDKNGAMVRPLVAMILDAISNWCGLYGYDIVTGTWYGLMAMISVTLMSCINISSTISDEMLEVAIAVSKYVQDIEHLEGSILISLCRDGRVVKQLEEIVFELGSHMAECVIIWSPILLEKKKDKLMSPVLALSLSGEDKLDYRNASRVDFGYMILQTNCEKNIAPCGKSIRNESFIVIKLDIGDSYVNQVHKSRLIRRLPRRQAQCAQDQGGVRPGAVRPAPGAVWDKMVVVHAKARNHRELNAASIQVETVLGDGIDGSKIHLKRQYQISRESEKDKNGAGKDKVRDSRSELVDAVSSSPAYKEDLVMSESVPSPDNTSRSLLAPIHLLDDDQDDDVDELVFENNKHDFFGTHEPLMNGNLDSKLQNEDTMRDASNKQLGEHLLGAALGALHVKPVILKRHRRKDRAWRFKVSSKHLREIIRKRQPGSSRGIGKPFDTGKLEYGINEKMVVTEIQWSQMVYDPP
ncbi:hypothetical protein L2E82_37973 [Cichorium intybus]|uniref:Uncharacterized protein n=1 Tax=Cichorium intybus TaxID=13427 RepID=A0ACB9AFN2_CICIN|nr:hypothetical protein L2E82_37973 [Cichorium intybus]